MNLNDLEELQKKARNVLIYGLLLTICASIGGYYYFREVAAILWTILLGLFGTFFFFRKPQKKFNEAFRDTYALRIFNMFFSNVKYEKETLINYDFISELKCFKDQEYFDSEDIVEAKYKGHKYIESFLDFGVISTGGEDSTMRKVPFFTGKWMIFEFNKSFKSDIRIYKKGIRKIGINSKDKNYQLINIDNDIFKKLFKVYAHNEKEGLEIVNSSFINSINNLIINISYPIIICTKDNKLHLGIDSFKNAFDYSIFKKLDEEEIINKLSVDYKEVTKFIDEIYMNDSLFKKME